MEEPSSRWAYSLFAAIIAAALLWLLGSGFVRVVAATVEAGRGFHCGSGELVLETGQRLVRHPNGCGWVPAVQSPTDPTKPYVSPRAYIGRGVTIRDNARVPADADIRGITTIGGNTVVSSGARIRDGKALVTVPSTLP